MTDLSTLTSEEIVHEARELRGDDDLFSAVMDEILARLNAKEEEVFALPVSVSEAIRHQFGSGKRTFDAITRRVRFAYRIWQDKYGPWTPEQAEYAESLIVWAINRASSASSPQHARPRVYTSLDLIIHHERTHEGFRQRAGAEVDITKHLEGLAA